MNESNSNWALLREYQMVLLDTLKAFDAICREHGLKYWLSAGTCLGAVRHGGFIPWDDDIDVEMYWNDYARLREVFTANDDYVLQTRENDLFYTEGLAKFRHRHSAVEETVGGYDRHFTFKGAFVDIFIIDKATDRASQHFKHAGKRLHLFTKKARLNALEMKLFRFLKQRYLRNLAAAREIEARKPDARTRYTLGCFSNKIIWDDADFAEVLMMPFEDMLAPVPAGYDHYLRKWFGDYMQLPPEEDRKPFQHMVSVTIGGVRHQV